MFKPVDYPDPDWSYNALVNLTPNDWDAYARSFKALADVAITYADEGGFILPKKGVTYSLGDPSVQVVKITRVVYAICFCYRHYLELRFKDLIRKAGTLLDQRLTYPNNHDLVKLWNALRPLLEQIWEGESFGKIEEVVCGFSQVDPSSTAFRYPVDTRGSPSLLFGRRKTISVKRLKDAIDDISLGLDGASLAIEDYIQTKYETEYEQWIQENM